MHCQVLCDLPNFCVKSGISAIKELISMKNAFDESGEERPLACSLCVATANTACVGSTGVSCTQGLVLVNLSHAAPIAASVSINNSIFVLVFLSALSKVVRNVLRSRGEESWVATILLLFFLNFTL